MAVCRKRSTIERARLLVDLVLHRLAALGISMMALRSQGGFTPDGILERSMEEVLAEKSCAAEELLGRNMERG